MALIVWLAAASSATCLGLSPPVTGALVAGFAPSGTYSGHWGVDLAASVGSPVRAAAEGTVSFSGTVVGNLTVTIQHGGGLRTSYSYLTDTKVVAGQRVLRGETIGTSGLGHGEPLLHFSTRIADRYVDPARLLGCRTWFPAWALRLAPLYRQGAAYASARASGHPGRDLRSTPLRSSARR